MKILPRVTLGDPVLRNKTVRMPLRILRTAYFRDLVRRMFYTMRRAPGIGLAAPQIGVSLPVAVIEVRPIPTRPGVKPVPKTVLVNPKILRASRATVADWEGCLSFMGYRGLVPRPKSVTVEYSDEAGKQHVRTLHGLEARVFQHEIDHLNGLIYIDRMRDMKTLMTAREFVARIMKPAAKKAASKGRRA